MPPGGSEIHRDRSCPESAKLPARAADTTSSGPSARCTQALVPARAEEWCIACQTRQGSQAGRPRVRQRALDLVAALAELGRHAGERSLVARIAPRDRAVGHHAATGAIPSPTPARPPNSTSPRGRLAIERRAISRRSSRDVASETTWVRATATSTTTQPSCRWTLTRDPRDIFGWVSARERSDTARPGSARPDLLVRGHRAAHRCA